MPLRAIILLVFFVASLPVCFFRPFYGIMLWTVVAFLNPQSFTWNAAAVFPWAMAVAIPTLLGLFAFETGLNRLVRRECVLLAAIWLWFTVTTLVSTNSSMFAHHAHDTWYQWNLISKILFMTFVTIAVVADFHRLRLLVLVIAGCFGLLVLKTLPFLITTKGAHRLYGPDNSMIADNNDFGLALNMTLPLFFFLAQAETNPWLKRLFGFLWLATIPAIFFTYSRGALVGLVVMFSLMLLRLKHRALLIPIVAAGILFATMFAPDAWKTRMDPTRTDALDASARARLEVWKYSWRLASDFPITGGGFATFTQELFFTYLPGARVIGPHSVYFQILAEHGFVGLLLYLSLMFSSWNTARRLANTAQLNGDSFVSHYATMFQFALVGFLASGLFLGRAYFDYAFCIVACIMILKRLATEEWTRDAEYEFEEIESAPYGEVAPHNGGALWAR